MNCSAGSIIADGEVAERLNALDSKSSLESHPTGVRIPPSPFRIWLLAANIFFDNH
jgi:hypothetical protein